MKMIPQNRANRRKSRFQRRRDAGKEKAKLTESQQKIDAHRAKKRKHVKEDDTNG